MKKRARIILLVVGLLAGWWGLFHLPYHDQLTDLLPRSLHRAILLFENSPLHNRLILGATSENPDTLFPAMQTIQAQLENQHFITPPFVPGMDFVTKLIDSLPSYFSAQDAALLETHLTPSYIQTKLAEDKQRLTSLGGIIEKQRIAQDPLDFLSLLTDKWRAFQVGNSTFENGGLRTPDGKIFLGFFTPAFEASDFARALAFEQTFKQIQQQLPLHVHAFFLGAVRYTLENIKLIRRDLTVVSISASVGLLLVFLSLLRHKKALWAYIIALAVIAPAACITYGVFGRINALTLGFGSVCAGLSADAVIYLFFAAQQTHPLRAVKKLRFHLICNFISSAVCFGALFFSSVEVFRQMAVFGVSALGISLLITLYILPPFFTHCTPAKRVQYACSFGGLTKRECVGVLGMLLLFGVWGFLHTHVSGDLARLNGGSKTLEKDRLLAQRVLNTAEAQGLLFVTGNSREEVLLKSEKLSALLPAPLAVNGIFLTPVTQAKNRERWQNFWSAARVNYLKLLVEEDAPAFGFSPHAFDGFFTRLMDNSFETSAVDFTDFYNPFITLPDGTQGVVHIVPDWPAYAQAAAENAAVFVSQSGLQKQIVSSVKSEAWRVFLAAILLNALAVGILLKSMRLMLWAFVPVVLGACLLFGVSALMGKELNVFAFIFLPLLVGLGLDYGIFQVIKYTQGDFLYPSKSLLAAGCSTLAGFGVLILAAHPVLHMMGWTALLGIGGAMAGAFLILPPFLKENA